MYYVFVRSINCVHIPSRDRIMISEYRNKYDFGMVDWSISAVLNIHLLSSCAEQHLLDQNDNLILP